MPGRRPSTDVPARIPRIRRGEIRTVIREDLYEVTAGKDTHLATFEGGAIPVDTTVDMRFHAERNQWRIEYQNLAAALAPIWYLYDGTNDANSRFEMGRDPVLLVAYQPGDTGNFNFVSSNMQVNVDGRIILFVQTSSLTPWYIHRTDDGGQTWRQIQWAAAASATNWHVTYSRWISPLGERIVHMCAYADTGSDATRGIYYNAYNIDTDTLAFGAIGTKVLARSGASENPEGFMAVARSGDIYIYQTNPLTVRRSGDGGATWVTYAQYPYSTNSSSKMLALPDFASADSRDFVVLNNDNWLGGATDGHRITMARYSRATNTWGSLITIPQDNTITDTTSEPPLPVVQDRVTGHIKLIAFDSHPTISANNEVRTWDLYGNTVVQRTPIVTGSASFLRSSVCKVLDRIYVFNTVAVAGVFPAGLVKIEFWYSDDDMITWQGPFLWNTPIPDWQGAEIDISAPIYLDPLPKEAAQGPLFNS